MVAVSRYYDFATRAHSARERFAQVVYAYYTTLRTYV